MVHHLDTGPFADQTQNNHSKSRLVRYSDAYCINNNIHSLVVVFIKKLDSIRHKTNWTNLIMLLVLVVLQRIASIYFFNPIFIDAVKVVFFRKNEIKIVGDAQRFIGLVRL